MGYVGIEGGVSLCPTNVTEGQQFTGSRSFTAEQVATAAELTGDLNPLHVDSNYARGRGYENVVVHGVLVQSMVSALLGNAFSGCMVTEFSAWFKRPLLAEETAEVTLTVTRVRDLARKAGVVCLEMSLAIRTDCGKNLSEGSCKIAIPVT